MSAKPENELRAAWQAKAALLRSRGQKNTLHDINQAADYLDAAADAILARQIGEPEPVAWRYRLDKRYPWAFTGDAIDADRLSRLGELEPLYATPPAQAEAQARVEALEVGLEPFAKMGRLIDGPFGPRGGGGTPDDGAFVSGGAWSENGNSRTVTWGDFRRATALLSGSTPKPARVEE